MSKDYVMQLEATAENYKRDNKILKEELIKLRNSQSEFRCPLEVLVKALKQGYVYFDTVTTENHNKKGKFKCLLTYDKFNEQFYWDTTCDPSGGFKGGTWLSGYNRTWFLKKDKSE